MNYQVKSTMDVEMFVQDIARGVDDPEGFHHSEDQLMQAVLQAIADGTAEDPAGMARAVLKTFDNEDATRWWA
jgi:hypothetical protein